MQRCTIIIPIECTFIIIHIFILKKYLLCASRFSIAWRRYSNMSVSREILFFFETIVEAACTALASMNRNMQFLKKKIKKIIFYLIIFSIFILKKLYIYFCAP